MGPLLPPFISFASGIALGDYLGLGYGVVIPAIVISAVFLLFIYLLRFRFTAIALIPLFLSLGCLFIIPYSSPALLPGHVLEKMGDDPISERTGTIIEGTVDYMESTGRRTRVWLDARGIIEADAFVPVSGRVLLSVNGRVELLPGDTIRALAMLGRPYAFGNPGEFDYGMWLKRRGVLVTGYVKSDRLIERVEKGSGPHAFIQSARQEIARLIDSSGARYPEPLKALIVSGQGGIDSRLRESFAETGTAHILSISGLHIGMVAAFSYWATLFLLRRSERALLYLNAKKAALVVSALPAIVYALLAGLTPPTERAIIMVLAFIASFSFGRGKDHLNTLSLAGLIILAASPGSIWDVSFQLSFVAMASIIILVPRLKELITFDPESPWAKKMFLFAPGLKSLLSPSDEDPMKRPEDGRGWAILGFIKKRAVPLVLVTVAAGLGTSPLLAYHFQRVSLAGLAANLLAVPIAGAVVPLLLVASAMLPVSSTLAWAAVFPADLAFAALAAVVEFFAAIPYASLWVSPPAPHGIALYFALILSLAYIKRARLFRYSALASIVLLAAAPALATKNTTGLLRITYLSVGQGESAFIELPDGKSMLMDGGGSNNPDFDTGERIVAPFLRAKGVERIDYMVLSHAQQDHMGGLAFIARNFEVGEFWWNGQGGLGRLGTALYEKGVMKRVVNASVDKLDVGGAVFEVLNPMGAMLNDENDNSLVLMARFGKRSFLFTGDIGEKAEERLLERDLKADVLKAPHHGSRYSSSAAFIERVSPSIAVISVGRKNSFGFPHEETLLKYKEAGIEVLRTDTMGAVIIETDGTSLDALGYLTGNGL